MFDYGAIDGAELNAFEINGGYFAVETDGTASIAVTGAATLVRQAVLAGTVALAFDVDAVATRVATLVAAAGVAIGASAAARRVAFMSGASVIAITQSLHLAHNALRAALVTFHVEAEPRRYLVPEQADEGCP